MKPIVLFAPILALTLAACGSTEIKESRETVIEKPVVSQAPREIIVERQVQVLPAQPLRNCSYGPGTYTSSTMTCQGGYQFQCVDGTWIGRNMAC